MSAIEIFPNLLWSSNHPSTHPGTLTGSGPYAGILLKLFSLKYSRVRSSGDLPLAFKP